MHLELTNPVDCVGDFTYDFYWQHRGKRLNPNEVIPYQKHTSYTYKEVVSALKNGEDVYIKGNVGHRLGSSMGVDLKFFGGRGNALKVGSIVVDGDVDSRMGISMVSGAIYVKGRVKPPMGNVVEVVSDREGYHKYCSITDILHGQEENLLPPNLLKKDTLFLKDKVIRDTIAARLSADKRVVVEGDAGMSTGILMRKGMVHVHGNAGMNAGVLLSGGVLIVNNAGEFAGAYMRDGILIIAGRARGYVGANMKAGCIFYKGDALLKPTQLNGDDISMLVKLLDITQIEAMMFRKYCKRGTKKRDG